MAKLKRPNGRKIASIKKLAREECNEPESIDAMVDTANQLMKLDGYDYTYTPASFEKDMASPKKRKREFADKGTLKAMKTIKKLCDVMGKDAVM
jgi:hypothetical protein